VVCRLVCVVVLSLITPCRAQEPAAKSPPANNVTIEQALDHLSKVEAGLLRQIDVARKAIDAEVTAGRLPEEQAKKLKDIWNNLTADQVNKALAGAAPMKENAALAAALRDIDTEWTAAQTERLAVLKAAHVDAKTRAIEIGRTGTKATEADALILQVERLEHAQYALTPAFARQQSFRQIVNFLDGFRRVMESLPQENATNLGFAMFNWNNNAINLFTPVADGVVRTRIDSIHAEVNKEDDTARRDLEIALRDQATEETLKKAADRLTRASKRKEQLRTGSPFGPRGESAVGPRDYRPLIEASLALKGTDPDRASRAVKTARSQFGEKPESLIVKEILERWEREVGEIAERGKRVKQKEIADRLQTLRTRMASATGPADLDAVAQALREEKREKDNEGTQQLNQAAHQIATVALAWRKVDFAALKTVNESDAALLPGMDEDLRAVRTRATRDVLAQLWQTPEIKQPPLAGLAPEVALEKLSDDLATKGEWRRLLVLTRNRAEAHMISEGPGAANDLTSALREFITGQNLELAEQWFSAVEAYKNVLRSSSLRAPTKEAAERVKALTKAHPEAFRPPGPSAEKKKE
jgi:hypothetical protein